MDPRERLNAARNKLDTAERAALDTLLSQTNETWAEDGVGAAAQLSVGLGPRYTDAGLLGRGGMGEVRRVHDTVLNRSAAMKIIRVDRTGSSRSQARFLAEARTLAQLQHPGIIPVYDAGTLPDGRAFFVMREVVGQTLGQVIETAHAGVLTPARRRTLVDRFRQVCEAMSYAHSRGVIHRDLKPANILVGGFGEVLVVDWGLTKTLEGADASLSAVTGDSTTVTQVGAVSGTPRYMAPEQARGDVQRVGPWTDVFALGLILHEIFAGTPLMSGATLQALIPQIDSASQRVADAGEPLPPALYRLLQRCLARRPEDRPQSATLVRDAIRDWLDGVEREAEARRLVTQVAAGRQEIDNLRALAAQLRVEAEDGLAEVVPWAPEAAKAEHWRLEDEAERLDQEARRLELDGELSLRRAVAHAPESAEPRRALAALYRARHTIAEADHDGDAARVAEAQLRAYGADDNAAYLEGVGAVTLVTDPPGADVIAWRMETRNRRLQRGTAMSLGRTPLRAVPLAMGSWELELRHPERERQVVPVHIRRGEHVDGCAPGEREPTPIRLLRDGERQADEVYVPAGWFWSGPPPGHGERAQHPWRRVWADGFFITRTVLTWDRVRGLLHHLVDTGRQDEALRIAPRDRAAEVDGGPLLFSFDNGRFGDTATVRHVTLGPDYPAVMIRAAGAARFAEVASEIAGLHYRLPSELEFEKAARGVDGRLFSIGDHQDGAWFNGWDSHPQGKPTHRPVGSMPMDRSPYGMLDACGTAMTWVLEPYERDPVVNHRLEIAVPDQWTGPWITRGLHYAGRLPAVYIRHPTEAEYRGLGLGIRLARSLPGA